MPLLTKVGSFQKINTTGVQAITGIGFVPKAIIFWTTGSNVASGTWDQHILGSLSFTAGPTNSFSVSFASADAVATSDTARRMAAKAITQVQTDAVVAYEADLQSFDADGFTLNWTTNSAIGHFHSNHINYMALGGSDITGAKVVNWQAPTAVGNKAVVGAGFKPDLVFHATAPINTALPVSAASAFFGFGTMNKHGQQWFNGFVSNDAVSPSNTSRWQQTDAAYGYPGVNENPDQQAHFVSMDADGFTLHFANQSGYASNVVSLCLQGVSSKIGAFAKTTAAAPAAQSIERVGFQPKALLSSSVSYMADAAPRAAAYWSLGGSDGTSHRATLLSDGDALNPTNADSIFFNDAAVVDAANLASTGSKSIVTFTTDGFDLSFNPNANYADEILYLALGDAGVDTYPATVDSTAHGSPSATAFSNQRKIDRCQNGNLWALHADANDVYGYFHLSTDSGKTWTFVTSVNGLTNGSFFIDLDDYAHVVWKQSGTGGARTDGHIYYMRGTPNAARTAWTWSAAVAVASNTLNNYPDVVAHREGTGWKVHIATSYLAGSAPPYNSAIYWSVTVDSAGTITAGGAVEIGTNAAVSVHTWPSIDFNHTGDGKTVAGGTPHLYAGWSAGKTGAGFGIRFRKAVYSAGSWTWNAEVEIDSTRYIDIIDRWLNCLFDGTRVLIIGYLLDGINGDLVLHERDVADTITVLRVLVDNAAGSTNDQQNSGSSSYDSAGNVYLISRGNAAGSPTIARKWTRSTNTQSIVILDYPAAGNASIIPYVSAKRGHIGGIEWVYTSGNNSPYAVKYDRITLLVQIQLALQALWSVRTLTAKPFEGRWNVLNSVSPVVWAANWSVRMAVASNLVTSWNMAGFVQRVFQTTWNVSTRTAKDFAGQWSIKRLVPQSITAAWKVRSHTLWTQIGKVAARWEKD